MFELLVGLAAGGLTGHVIGGRMYQRRLRRAVAAVPGDQLALATIERAALHVRAVPDRRPSL